jgi:hypothetical protein
MIIYSAREHSSLAIKFHCQDGPAIIFETYHNGRLTIRYGW